MRVIFLDIDGVLNDHMPHANGYCGIDPAKVAILNRVVDATGARLVISSAWRYMLHGGAMTREGFRYLLLVHGLSRGAVVEGYTVPDEHTPGRGEQIDRWLSRAGDGSPYVVLDDGSPSDGSCGTDLTDSLARCHGERWIRVDGSVGLTEADAGRAIRLLGLPSWPDPARPPGS